MSLGALEGVAVRGFTAHLLLAVQVRYQELMLETKELQDKDV